MNLKFKSSSDFSLLLKEQRSRLQSVRNKNISFVAKYSNDDDPYSKPGSNLYIKPGSKSVDKLYFSVNPKQQEDNKEEN